jgi:hypothetical protein
MGYPQHTQVSLTEVNLATFIQGLSSYTIYTPHTIGTGIIPALEFVNEPGMNLISWQELIITAGSMFISNDNTVRIPCHRLGDIFRQLFVELIDKAQGTPMVNPPIDVSIDMVHNNSTDIIEHDFDYIPLVCMQGTEINIKIKFDLDPTTLLQNYDIRLTYRMGYLSNSKRLELTGANRVVICDTYKVFNGHVFGLTENINV